MKRKIYNFEFPSWCPEINIYGYRFYRVEDYEHQVKNLQHLVTVKSEFDIKQNTGGHAVTAYVDLPENEDQAILEWADRCTSLKDILLLVSIFTGRDVFDVDEEFVEDGSVTIMADPRCYQYGGLIRVSIPYEKSLCPEEEHHFFDIGLEIELNRIYKLMGTIDWQNNFKRGYYLLLARQAFRRQILEATFIQSWTIWEHLYSIFNEKKLSANKIYRTHASSKIAYLLTKYDLLNEIDNKAFKRIRSLADIRNRLVHYGRFPERSSVQDDAVLFVRLTEFILAKTLGLFPSNIFNTMEKLEAFLKEND